MALAIIILSGFGLSAGFAQQTHSSAGGDAAGAGGSASYTVGQLVYTTETDSTGTAAQGVQHPYEILTVGVVNTDRSFSLKAFPNPASDYLSLEMDKLQTKALVYQLTDLKGAVLKEGAILSNQTRIVVGDLPAATYFVRISENTSLLHTFKIIKQ
ncbi:MAG: T9SS type A sorting domain-containing protein [Bacteroidia bacterium]